MKYVAFFRNVNLGHPKSPTRPQLESAFTSAGAESPQSFQTNGTMVFGADSEPKALKIVARACRTLESVCGLEEPAFTCGLTHLAKLVAGDPFTGVDMEDIYMCCASFMPSHAIRRVKAPLRSPRGEVEIVRVTSRTVLSTIRRIGSSQGSPTAFLEQRFSVPVTTRNWNTILRLVKKHA